MMADKIERDRLLAKYAERGALALAEHTPDFTPNALEILFVRCLHEELEKVRPGDRLDAIEKMLCGIFAAWLSPRFPASGSQGPADGAARLGLDGLHDDEILRTLDHPFVKRAMSKKPSTGDPETPRRNPSDVSRSTFPAAAHKVIRAAQAAQRIWYAAWTRNDRWGNELADAMATYVARELRDHLQGYPEAQHLDVAMQFFTAFSTRTSRTSPPISMREPTSPTTRSTIPRVTVDSSAISRSSIAWLRGTR